MKNIHILPTDKPSRLFDDGIELYLGELKDRKGHPVTSYNIYITSDEEIKEGDWIFNPYTEYPYKADYKLVENSKQTKDFHIKKIILTTDQDLIKDGVQSIPDEFLEWFVKNPSCEYIEIENVYDKFLNGDKRSVSDFRKKYKINIPKEELKQCCDSGIVDDFCINTLKCKHAIEEPKQELKVGDNTNFGIITDIKEYSVCFGKNKIGVDIWYKKSDVKLEPKKETLEEAAEKYDENDPNDEYGKSYRAFIEGAKWQQERMYSEEEVKNLIKIIEWYDKESDVRPNYTPDIEERIGEISMWDWFEQFKKK